MAVTFDVFPFDRQNEFIAGLFCFTEINSTYCVDDFFYAVFQKIRQFQIAVFKCQRVRWIVHQGEIYFVLQFNCL